jgi:ribosomal protein S9
MPRGNRVYPVNSATADRPFFRIVLVLSGGTSSRAAAARMGHVRFLLERNPPNRPLVPAGPPAFFRESNSAPQNQKKELYVLQKRSSRLTNQERRHRSKTSGENLPLRTDQSRRVGK